MRFEILTLTAVLAGCVSAQSSPSIPACANSCITEALPASCNLDPSCICTTKSFITDISCCIYKNCDASDQQAALAYAHSICDPVGGSSLLPASAGCTANSTSSATSGSSSGGGSAAATTTGSAAGSSASGASSSMSSAMSSASASASAAASSASAGQSSATSSAGAAATSAAGNAADGRMSVEGVGLGVVGAALLGLAALL